MELSPNTFFFLLRRDTEEKIFSLLRASVANVHLVYYIETWKLFKDNYKEYNQFVPNSRITSGSTPPSLPEEAGFKPFRDEIFIDVLQ